MQRCWVESPSRGNCRVIAKTLILQSGKFAEPQNSHGEVSHSIVHLSFPLQKSTVWVRRQIKFARSVLCSCPFCLSRAGSCAGGPRGGGHPAALRGSGDTDKLDTDCSLPTFSFWSPQSATPRARAARGARPTTARPVPRPASCWPAGVSPPAPRGCSPEDAAAPVSAWCTSALLAVIRDAATFVRGYLSIFRGEQGSAVSGNGISS